MANIDITAKKLLSEKNQDALVSAVKAKNLFRVITTDIIVTDISADKPVSDITAYKLMSEVTTDNFVSDKSDFQCLIPRLDETLKKRKTSKRVAIDDLSYKRDECTNCKTCNGG